MRKHTIEFVRVKFERDGYKCLSKKYINAKVGLKYICPKGHRGVITWSDWKSGNRCEECGGSKKHTIEFVKKLIEEENWKLVSTEYINAHSKLNCICQNGHEVAISWACWRRGTRCPMCSGNKRLALSFIKSEFEKEGWGCTTNSYVNNSTGLNCICPNGHHVSMCWSCWQRGDRCPKCSNKGTSVWESIIKQFVRALEIPFLENDRTLILNPNTNCYLELDLWFPDLNKAIECNGMYWHSKKDRKDLDKLKQDWCKDNSVSLLIVTDADWNKDIKKCQKGIQNFLN